ncbi:hypothetical protein JTB14_035768 [Gonioctena quinquepunctata]|nr:hypothetical protein JTB14_035768 [Gonioctena quinquepunctata]
MNEEDEIDILGDYKLDILLSKGNSNIYDEESSLVSQNSDLLNCDYTIHPQWLLDRPSANPDNWYTNNRDGSTEREDEALGHIVSTENSITDESGWTEKEKNLLERGIEIFGKSNERLSQFIGSKLASEVKYYLKNFYSEQHNNRTSNEGLLGTRVNFVADVLDDNQIPTSIEEVIASVSTAKPTVQTLNRSPRKKTISTSSTSGMGKKGRQVSPNKHPSRCVKQKNIQREKILSPTKKGKYSVKTMELKDPERKRNNSMKLKVKSMVGNEKNPIKQKIVNVVNKRNTANEIKTVEITTGQGLSVPICEGEEIVKIKSSAEDSDTDIEIDVELSDEETQASKIKVPKLENDSKKSEAKDQEVLVKSECTASETPNFHPVALNEKLQKALNSLEEPVCEVELDENTVSDLEKVINHDYFGEGMAKTPERYLKIRNHILRGWKNQKPNYLYKTISRHGLKNCGDVNSFGRIHNFLEQIGAINFGCDQVTYYRPLLELLQEQNLPRNKKKYDVKNSNTISLSTLGARPRHKPKLFNDGEGGYTLSHDEQGNVIKHTVIHQEPIVTHRLYVKKPTIRLIYCRPFTDNNQQPYSVKMSLAALLAMDFHSHSSLTEVMGLVAGFWVPQTKTLSVTHYEPCRNMASSATHCDMCPISQAKAADTVHSMGLDILGWFHSHPTFAPEPSHQDLETQQILQQWIGQNRPCIGVILSPFSANGALIASPLRCMMVNKKDNFEDQFVPYKFGVEINSEDFVVEDCLCDLQRVLEFSLVCSKESRVDFADSYFQDGTITFLEKYITSVRMRLARCGTLSKSACDELIQAVKDICRKSKVYPLILLHNFLRCPKQMNISETVPVGLQQTKHAEQWDSMAVATPIVMSSTFKQYGPANFKKYEYGRSGNPTREVLENVLAKLDNATYGLAFASGLGANTAIFGLLKSGDNVILGDDIYGGTHRLFNKIISNYNITVTMVEMEDISNLEKAIKPNTKLIWVESPTNPTLKVIDIRAAAEIAKKHNIILAVDNTFLTPYLQRPLDLGADLVVYSLTKYMNGHSDIIMGSIATSNQELYEKLKFLQNAMGIVPSPFDCYQVNRSLKTLALRMQQHQKAGMTIANYLNKHPQVEKVLHPGFPSHPQHKIHKKQTSGQSGIFSFYLKGGLEESKKFLSSLKIFTLAESLGGYESLAELPSVMTHASVPPEERKVLGISDNLIRVSIGLEDEEDLIADLDNAFKSIK